MKFFGYLLIACLALAALRLVLMGLLVAVALSLIWWSIRRPTDVLAFFAMVAILNVINAYPLAVVILVAVGLLIWMCKRSAA